MIAPSPPGRGRAGFSLTAAARHDRAITSGRPGDRTETDGATERTRTGTASGISRTAAAPDAAGRQRASKGAT